ncbi:tRNA pseudouridine(38-40) synthase TruA [Ruminococcaceae bacterium OttesenSCG-928-A16]|nr:tRNA pseudouridine(38-40) synthase TruA [Ruminococcaceae bacterium OttesenSCG-928-A16]
MEKNFLLTLAFNGAAYHGFQVQQNALSVCTVLQNAMQKVLHARPDVKGCSRTDAGVHATEYCVSFKSDTAIPPHKLPLAFNSHLPKDIRVKSARQVPQGFHARYSASGKQYRYVFLSSSVDDPLAPGLYYRVAPGLNAAEMNKAGKLLVGKHNFASFMSAGSDIEDTVRTVHNLTVTPEGERVFVDIAADGFLYNMVRIIAGTLLKVGNGRLPATQVQAVLQAQNRAAAGETMPAKGLFLSKVFYPPSAFEE